MSVERTHRLFTVNQFQKMAETGILAESERLELLNGEIIEMPPIGSPHANVVDRLTLLIYRRIHSGILVRTQNPLILDEYSMPQPDLMIMREKSYATEHPTPEDILLLVEVSDSTLHFDRTQKLPLYAKAGIQESWIVNITQAQIEVYLQPVKDRYSITSLYRRGENLSPLHFPDIAFTIDELLI